MFKTFDEVSDWCWERAFAWGSFVQGTVGTQLVKSADSVGANLVEGDGRYSDADALHFFVIARASARETRYWLNKAARRKLLDTNEVRQQIDQLERATKALNTLIS